MTDGSTDRRARAESDWKTRVNRNARTVAVRAWTGPPTPAAEPTPAAGSTAPADPTAGASGGPAPAGSGEPAPKHDASWLAALRGALREAREDKLSTWAAALTYYSVLSIFPGLLVLVSALRLAGRKTMDTVLGEITANMPGTARSVLTGALDDLQSGAIATAGIAAVIGVLAALWSASSYVGSFMEAADMINDVRKKRPPLKKMAIRIGLTIVAGMIVSVSALAVVLTGGLARRVGDLVGLGSQVVAVWDLAKWPVLVILVSQLFALLYWAAPARRIHGFRVVTAGSLLATSIWMIASVIFGVYVSMFGSYNRTYGSVATVIVFLVWLWISNLAILLGAEFDAERQRLRGESTAGRDVLVRHLTVITRTPRRVGDRGRATRPR